MPEEHNILARSGLYERAVGKITGWLKPYLHHTTQEFINSAVAKYAKNNPRFARMIEFEVRRRGDGAGLTQDVAEPLVWVGVKTAAAVGVAIVAESFKNKKLKWIGDAAALGLVLNNVVDLFRLKPRFKAGLQGSLEMAKDRWQSIEETGIDPFSNQQNTREINPGGLAEAELARKYKKSLITPTSLMEQADKAPLPPGRS